MKKNIFKSLSMALALTLTLGFASCDNDDDNKLPAKPVVTLTEIGLENSKAAEQGGDLHLEGNILAEGLIKRIDIEIHKEGGTEQKIEKSFTEGKYIGVRNAEFHEHIDIPETAPLGEYHLHFTVTDQSGQSVTQEAHINIVENDGTEHEHHHE
jgi:hypothetical protein